MAEPTQIGGKVAGAARGAGAALEGYKGIFRKLMEEHAEVQSIMKRLAHSDNPKLRADLFPTLRAELLAHAHGEEQEVYPVFEGFADTKQLTAHGLSEHQEIERQLEQLSKLTLDAPEWQPLFLAIKSAVEDHVEEEENGIFPKAKEHLSDERLETLKQRYLAVKDQELAKLRPH